jgi:hypothetical protein
MFIYLLKKKSVNEVCLKLSKFRSFKLMVLIQIAILFHKDSNALYENHKGIFNELLARP